jgi:glycosyltransferase involved in cell wall biosynthesis
MNVPPRADRGVDRMDAACRGLAQQRAENPKPPVGQHEGTHDAAEPRPSPELRIAVAGPLGAMNAPGGGEVQMRATVDALTRLGVDARLWRPWEEPLGQFDVLHLFGSVPEHLTLATLARRRNVGVVVSPIAWFSWQACARESGPWWRRAAAVGKFALRAALPRIPSWRRRLYHAADVLLPNSHAEAQQLTRLFGVPTDRIHVTPNGADPRFADADPRPFRRLVGTDEFVLCPGRIEPRKNQLTLVRAMRGAELPVVLLGDAVPGHEDYLAQCRRDGGDQVIHVPRVDHGDPMLASAYAACSCLALCSWFETPGLVALEAALTGCPLVLPSAGAADEYFGEMVAYISPRDAGAIRRAVMKAVGQGRDPMLAAHVRHYLTWTVAARVTCEAYVRATESRATTLDRRRQTGFASKPNSSNVPTPAKTIPTEPTPATPTTSSHA